MAYPNITTNFSTLTDYKDRYRASHINALQTAVNSIIAAMPHKQQVVVVAKARGDYDNFASAAAAITDASASKPYVLLLMPGIYEVTGSTLKPYISLVGVGFPTIKLANGVVDDATGAHLINSTETNSGITIANLILDGNRVNQNVTVNSNFQGIHLENTSNFTIHNVLIKNTCAHGIYIYNSCSNFTISNCVAYNYGNDGIAIGTMTAGKEVHDGTITNCVCYDGDNVVTGQGCGISPYDGCYNIAIDNCACYSNTDVAHTKGAGIGIPSHYNGTTWTAEPAYNITISNCVLTGNFNGINIYGLWASSKFADSISISNCITANNYYYGITLNSVHKANISSCIIDANNQNGANGISGIFATGFNDVNIAGCTISNTVSGSSSAPGIAFFANSSKGIITGCTIKNNDAYGISIYDVTDITVVGNTIYDDQTPKTQSYGIREAGTADYNVITNNNVRGNAVTGILLAGANSKVNDNIGFVTENKGTSTVPNGATSVVVNHGLGFTPVNGQIIVTPVNNMGNATKFYVDTYTATQFTIHTNIDPGATTAIFAWAAIR